MNETLQAMGMLDAFHPSDADFSGMSDLARQMQLHISKVKQKTYVDVNEEGTEAAGVTSVEMRVTSVPTPFTLRADHPFLFVLRDAFTGHARPADPEGIAGAVDGTQPGRQPAHAGLEGEVALPAVHGYRKPVGNDQQP